MHVGSRQCNRSANIDTAAASRWADTVLSCMQIKVEAGTIDFVNIPLPQFGNALFIHLAWLCNLQVLFIFFILIWSLFLLLGALSALCTLQRRKHRAHRVTRQGDCKFCSGTAFSRNTSETHKTHLLNTQRRTSWHRQDKSEDAQLLRLSFVRRVYWWSCCRRISSSLTALRTVFTLLLSTLWFNRCEWCNDLQC